MKKALLCLLLALFLATVSSAQVFIGSRQAGMGGTGVASAVGLNAVAFNPAGLMKGPGGEFLFSLGFASQGMDQIAQSLTSAADPSQFMVNNYSSKLDANGNIYGILGLSFNHVGVSLIVPRLMASLSKPADSLDGTLSALALSGAVLTVGQTFGVPFLPASLDIGLNIKSLSVASGSITTTSPTAENTTTTASQTIVQGSGTGFDLGARTTVEIPFLADFSLGLALRDLAQTFKYKPKTRTDTYTYNPAGEPTISKGAESEGAETSATSPTTTALGLAGTVPGIGLKVAADISSTSAGTGILATGSDTVTSIGVEYPLMLGAMVLRGGVASGSNVSYTTLGAKINIPFLTLEIANVIDGKNSKNTSYVIDAGIAL